MSAKPTSSVSISPDNRSTCYFSGRKICKAGDPRISYYMRSEWTDGFQRRFVHVGKGHLNFSEVRYMKLMRHKDLTKATKAVTMSPAEVKFNDAVWEAKDMLDAYKNIIPAMEEALKKNDYYIPKKRPDLVTHLFADALLNGRGAKCPACSNRSLLYWGEEYECCGYISAVTPCPYKTKDALKREKFTLPVDCAEIEDIAELKKSALVEEEGHPDGPGFDPRVPSEDEDDDDVPPNMELKGMTFKLIGTFSTPRKELEATIAEHGGAVSNKSAEITHIIAGEKEIAKPKTKRTKAYKQAAATGVPIMKEEFITDLCGRSGPGLKLRQRKHHKKYRVDGKPGDKIPPVKAILEKEKKDEGGDDDDDDDDDENPRKRAKGPKRPPITPGSQLLQVDQFARMKDANIYVDDDNLAYNVMLNKADISTGVNKFYIIQLIQQGAGFVMFCRWGRVGDNSGIMSGYNYWGRGKPSYMSRRFKSVDKATQGFAEKFEKQTGWPWADVDNFQHQPGRYNMVELEGQMSVEDAQAKVEEATKTAKSASKQPGSVPKDLTSKLAPEVQDFVKLIFDKDMMRRSMADANIDLSKMPLGSLSQRQMKQILDILNGTRTVLDEKHKSTLLLDATNRFYTAIPHQFPTFRAPPVISTMEMLKRKLDLMEQLLEIQHANKLIKEGEEEVGVNRVDANYSKLKCDLQPVDQSSDEMEMLRKYVRNTHAKTHSQYKLEVESAFKVKKEGEEDKYKPFAEYDNRRLLWHGSRLTNWVGILSQGLRIAPPEAPVTGYVRVYFASMVSKSANYCFPSRSDSTGVLLLCEVALGDMYERLHSEYTAAESCQAAGKDSTWGIGKTTPDPKETIELDDGVSVPLGKGVSNPKAKGGALLYDEFIVYNTAQIKMRYVIKMKFKY
ncbi:poly polymerase [Salpingoeca rosetta]|uniref:Poly [ADP-ribose] polymerase n=1 Tax=Salpingoeca rosetta (strain ATCC 50818 / BSB-021) TaxID=946362 RepID=F2UF00_SALR5|nr:poly polymerase [Salpingoeca rosetta]EGD75200.1 poly polymerase [Salpingoeca rosetta]|eukprot:XP_004992253.1 poly polymerase [Salpingoeca rosetta]